MSKQKQAQDWVAGYTTVGVGIVVAAIVPGSTSIALLGLEATMVMHIGGIYRGTDITWSEATEIAGRVGLACVIGQIGTLELLNALPFVGWLAKAAIAGGIIAALGESIISFFEEEERKKYQFRVGFNSTFENNLLELRKRLVLEADKYRVAVIGQPGAGKSSLVRSLTDNKCIPLPEIGQETDATDWSIDIKSSFFSKFDNHHFVDSPGYDTSRHPINSYIEYFPFDRFDSILIVLKGKLHKSDNLIFEKIASNNSKIIITRCFSENISTQEENEIRREIRNAIPIYSGPIIFTSNRNKSGINELKEQIKLFV